MKDLGTPRPVNLGTLRDAVCIWYQQGCGHCDEFLPRAQVAAARAHIPIFAIDVGSGTRLADTYMIMTTPTVIRTRFGTTFRRADGALSDEELENFLR